MQLCVSLLQATKHAINRLRLQVLATKSVTSLLHQHFLAPHGTNIPLVGWWHADVAWSSHFPVNKSVKSQQNVSFSHALPCTCTCTLACAVRILKRSRPLNNTLPCAKNNTQCQLVEMITYSGVNDKFPYKQTLTECILEPFISQLRQPRYHQIPLWACSVITCHTSVAQRRDCISHSDPGWVCFWRLWVSKHQSLYWYKYQTETRKTGPNLLTS